MKYAGLISRYILILLAGLGNLYIFYQLFTPLTIKAVYLLLSIFSQASMENSSIIFRCTTIEIIPACVAGSAYYLLFILNLSTPSIKLTGRIKILLFTFTSLFILNIIRITLLALISQSIFFNAVHLIFWYVISIIFVAGIWMLSVRFFNIKSIPIYTDIKQLYKLIKRNPNKKAKITQGFVIRLIGGFMQVFSILFIITNPQSIIAWIFFTIGGGFLTIGGLIN